MNFAKKNIISSVHGECVGAYTHKNEIIYDAQISDFGLAKWLPENWSHHVVSPIEGTFGYVQISFYNLI